MVSTVVEEAVAVWATETGRPVRFEWRGRRYVVCAKPLPWVDSVPVWKDGGTAEPCTVVQPMWQVQAMSVDTGEIIQVDLAVGADRDWWRLTTMHE